MRTRLPARLLAPLLALLPLAGPATAAPADDLRALMAEHYRWVLAGDPVGASRHGDRSGDGRLADLSVETRDRRTEEARTFIARLNTVPADQLSDADRVNRTILIRDLQDQVDQSNYGQRDMIFTTFYGWHQGFAGLADNSAFNNRADYESYLARLAAYPVHNQQALALVANAVRGGFTLPCSALPNYERTIEGLIAEDPARSRLYVPFTRARPAFIDEADWTAMQGRARTLIGETVNPEFRRHAEYYRTQYLPRCTRTDGASALPNGEAYYGYLARSFTTTEMTPQQIHAVGLTEVRRIRTEMDRIAREAGHANRAAMIQQMRTEARYFVTTPEALLRESAYTTRIIDGHLPRLFGRLPRLPYTIRPIPAEEAPGTTTAYYGPGAPDAGIAGTYYVNTTTLNQRPLWEIPALTLHEAVPGHHLQIALQQELDLSPYRRNYAGYTAFVEGWALYAESLGRDMGLYDTPEKRMGELGYQMWRAARLVVDTGIHAFAWPRERAVAFMRENTTLTDANIDAEVNRYISWPGQALGYMIGRLKILEIRRRAERSLGERFDIRRFHDAVLANGPVPLSVLEAEMIRWIEAERERAR